MAKLKVKKGSKRGGAKVLTRSRVKRGRKVKTLGRATKKDS